ncbi:MAG: 4Fe-4S binding protein, partial [Clostridia bacterium]|nr:4Fe-4S binding protein [Clostridia bacterium]
RCAVGCIGCGICKNNFPEGAITVENGLASINPTLCVGCGLCAEKCPRKIIYRLAVLPLDP